LYQQAIISIDSSEYTALPFFLAAARLIGG
jgi:hypothetical protein